jgi:type III pantothenate kinase
MKLLFDIGNTRVKAAVWSAGELRATGAVAHAAADRSALWGGAADPDSIWIASVAAPEAGAALARELSEHFGQEPHFVHSRDEACGVRSAYAQPERLGVDRFLGLIAAHAQAAGPAVTASCGTALTLDALGAGGRHLGGLIVPGPELMQAALHNATARLGEPVPGAIVEAADNTADAIASGAWLAAAAVTERFAARVAQRVGTMPRLLLTGGGAARLAELVALPHRVDPDLVLRGLARLADAGG